MIRDLFGPSATTSWGLKVMMKKRLIHFCVSLVYGYIKVKISQALP